MKNENQRKIHQIYTLHEDILIRIILIEACVSLVELSQNPKSNEFKLHDLLRQENKKNYIIKQS